MHTIYYDPATIGLVSRTAPTSFGSLHYVGPEKRTSEEVVLFLHGFASSWGIWIPLIQATQHRYLKGRDVLLVDLPNFGKSENIAGHLRLEDIGNELLGLARQLGYTRIRVVGHSMGGFLTLDMAARHPELQSVHVVAGSYLTLVRVVNRPSRGLLISPAMTFFYVTFMLTSSSERLARMVNNLYWRRIADSNRPLYEVSGKAFLLASANGRGYDAATMWHGIPVPIYAVFGSRDRIVTTKDRLEFEHIVPDAHVTVLEAGHSLLVTHPAEVAAALFSELN